MRKTFKLSLLLFVALVATSLDLKAQTSDQITIKLYQVVLRPHLADDEVSSFAMMSVDTQIEVSPIDAWYNTDNSSLGYLFNDNIGKVLVTIYNSRGMVVYNKFINTEIMESGSVDISKLKGDTYKVQFTSLTKARTIYYGSFTIAE